MWQLTKVKAKIKGKCWVGVEGDMESQLQIEFYLAMIEEILT